MSRSIAWGALVFALTLLLDLPAAFVARHVPWHAEWQPSGVSGSVWHGRATRLASLGPLEWEVRPWAGEVQLNLGFQQRLWEGSIRGWPWNWQAQLAPRAVSALPATAWVLDGRWQGRLQVNGAGRRCRSAEGELVGKDLALLSPWQINLGSTRIELQCRDGLQLLADLQLPGEHGFKVEADLQRQHVRVDGRVEADAAVIPLLVQARWLHPPEQTFSKVLGKP